MAANDGTGTITQTLPASATLPLLAAPVLPKAMLRSVRQITVTLADPELGMKVEDRGGLPHQQRRTDQDLERRGTLFRQGRHEVLAVRLGRLVRSVQSRRRDRAD
eukprot:scaffold89510_cov63-Phaeocystis_antarctica.AAC.2